jgi:tetratricopeptide (TPR) repeat protein
MYYWAWMAGPYYMSMRRFDDALTVFNELKRSGKEVWNIDQTLEMAECYRLQGEINSARHLLEESVNVSSNWYRAVIFRNLALLQAISARDLTPAIKLITKAQAELNGPDDWITETMMRLQYASGKVDEALKSLQRLRYFWWGYGEQSNYRYRIAQLKATSGSIDARNYLNEAISNLTRMVRGEWSNGQNVDDASAYLAMALARAGRVDSARQQINWALKLEPERADIAYNAACAYTLVGDTTLALQWLKTAVKRGHQELWWARVDPDLDPLRKLSRFQNIMNDWDSRLRKLLERNPYSNSKQK